MRANSFLSIGVRWFGKTSTGLVAIHESTATAKRVQEGNAVEVDEHDSGVVRDFSEIQGCSTDYVVGGSSVRLSVSGAADAVIDWIVQVWIVELELS